MRIFWALLTSGILALNTLQAEFNHPIFCGQVACGYRQDSFHWGFNRREGSSSSSSSSAEINNFFNSSSSDKGHLFEQSFKTMRIAEVTGNFSYANCNNYYIRLNGGYGTILHGETHTEAFTDLRDPTRVTSKISGDAGHGHVSDLEVCVGYQFTSNGRRVVATPVIGYSWHNQNFNMHDADQKVNVLDTPSRLGDIDHLSFSYKPHWYGPFVGLDFMVIVENPCFIVYGSCEWHWSDKYRSQGRWKLHDRVFHDSFDAKFQDHAMGHGLYGYLGLDYRLGCGWYIGVVGYYRHFQAHHGRHKMQGLFTDLPTRRQNFGTIPVLGANDETHLQHIRWVSWSAAVALTFRFYDP